MNDTKQPKQQPVPDKLHRGSSAEERKNNVAETEIEDFFRLDQQRIPEVDRDRDEGIDTPS